MRNRSSRLSIIFAAIVPCLATSGCGLGWNTTDTRYDEPQSGRTHTVIVGRITTRHEGWRRLARISREALAERLREEGDFDVFVEAFPNDPSPGTIIVTGNVGEIDEGNELSRMSVRLGNASIDARFEIIGADGGTRAIFDCDAVSDGGVGFLGAAWDQVYIEDVARDVGWEAADAVVRWTRGEDVDGGWFAPARPAETPAAPPYP